jgi:predicted NUDIX family NTP pyrophosphohydrolase
MPAADSVPRRSSRLKSAGLLLFRRPDEAAQFLLVHPGGPYWARQDLGAWSIPKGLPEPGEDGLSAARREFVEETGLVPPPGPYARLADQRQRGGKLVSCWMAEGDLDLASFRSNTFEMEWPPRSGRMVAFPECDRIAYFDAGEAAGKILAGQQGFIEEALARVAAAPIA